MTQLATRADDMVGTIMERVIAHGDLKELAPAERVAYYNRVCESLGLNPYTRPFEYLTLNNKLTLYARKDATDQLRKLNAVSVEVISRDLIGDLYVVTARATTADGRSDEDIGAVHVKGLAGEALANAYMKATTKAKRRVTLSIVGLGFTDHTEVEAIEGARYVDVDPDSGEIQGERPALPEPSGPKHPHSAECSEPGCGEFVVDSTRYQHEDKDWDGAHLMDTSLRWFGRYVCFEHWKLLAAKKKKGGR